MNGLTEPQKRIWRHLCSVNNSRCLAKCTLWTQGFNSFNRRTVYIVFVEGLLGSWQGSFPGINVHVLIRAPPPPLMFKHRCSNTDWWLMFKHRLIFKHRLKEQAVITVIDSTKIYKWHFSRVVIVFKLSTIVKLVNYTLHFVCQRSFLFNSRQPFGFFGPQIIKREKVETQLIFITTQHPAVQKTRDGKLKCNRKSASDLLIIWRLW